jgi:hypothetical protein
VHPSDQSRLELYAVLVEGRRIARVGRRFDDAAPSFDDALCSRPRSPARSFPRIVQIGSEDRANTHAFAWMVLIGASERIVTLERSFGAIPIRASAFSAERANDRHRL